MGAKNSKDNFNRDLQARQSQKKSYNKFRQSVGKLMKNVKKVDYKNKEKLLELEIAVKSLTNDLELAGVDLEEKFQTIHDDFIKKCEEMNVIVKDKLQQNDRMVEELEIETVTNENLICNMDLSFFAEDLEDKETTNKPKKVDKKKTDEDVLVEQILTPSANGEVVTDVYDMTTKKDKKQKKPKNKQNSEDSDACSDITDKNDTLSKKKFLSFLRRKKPKIVEEELAPEINSLEGSEIIVIQDPENEHRSEQNIEVNVIQQAIEHKSGKKPKKEKRRSKFYDDELSLPPLPTTDVVHKSDPLSQIENIRETIKTLEEMTWNYRKHKRGNYDYIHDNLCLCIDTLKNLEYDGMLTIRHEKKRAMEDAQQCLDVLEEKVDVPERYDHQKPQIVVKRSSSARQNSVEFLEISDTDDVRVFSDFTTEVSSPERLDFKITEYEEKADSRYSTDFSEDEDLQNILLSLEEENLDGKSNEDKKKPVLITSF